MNKLPSQQELEAASDKVIDDVIDYDLNILFCGINPGLYTAYTGFHFARPGNKFWKALFKAGITPRLFQPSEQSELLNLGYGITNFVSRTSVKATDLSKEEFEIGSKKLNDKVLKYKPKVLAILGLGAYRTGFNKPKAIIGLQKEKIGKTFIWALPNPSGLNASYPLDRIAGILKEVKDFSVSLQK